MKIYIFDMDGTLTPARQPMTPDFSRRGSSRIWRILPPVPIMKR